MLDKDAVALIWCYIIVCESYKLYDTARHTRALLRGTNTCAEECIRYADCKASYYKKHRAFLRKLEEHVMNLTFEDEVTNVLSVKYRAKIIKQLERVTLWTND